MHTILQPEGWAKPVGYANGVAARGRLVFIGGQVGWNTESKFETDDFVGQVRQTLANVVAVLAEAGGEPRHITSMTWYFTDKAEYVGNLKGIGEAYRAVVGRHFPAMAAMQVVALVEDRAKVEIQATAVIPD
ncbi:RidA family protein [Mesorhizobium sp.]|uniref:RidA family protein n=1 Tax=Mesorhizobium sp. TaxID=1871066 RepID=UPI000FE91DCE|nr:RidA family protein [Mesorhizobium sp.]RWD70689.1 MAG: RidA family protein [Mesorhizobium sp.]TIV59416.1 MAG: RidA family protein [Mesorhizobium sp.]